MLQRYFSTLLILLGLMGCQATVTEPEIELTDITEAQLNDLIFAVDYGQLINNSLDDDQKSLVKLMRLGKSVDGGGAYGFGVMLQTIALEIGDDDFAGATAKLTSAEKKLIHELLLAGFDYGDRRYEVTDFEIVLPQTYATTNIQ
ncbi:hypothetical protein Lepto7376_0201 [[Leptolyngbya] sp. PCC 7376]|uniref:hypothetical protein n=1 Tax=[Leptolyngbya] sp. PCC 7376 TaxID=111781 RepID=UPI00029EE804|nr:hypothetical protein [[Leptolyngbya] sp. PCC 7376]AFY36646.1 hypothetical protein Lepto7376_0201 [[Leptolyngbya] sp. PCC 7376]